MANDKNEFWRVLKDPEYAIMRPVYHTIRGTLNTSKEADALRAATDLKELLRKLDGG
jgi:hypothetical protein